jgi:hypothetical protein
MKLLSGRMTFIGFAYVTLITAVFTIAFGAIGAGVAALAFPRHDGMIFGCGWGGMLLSGAVAGRFNRWLLARVRDSMLKPWQCQHCGYDLRGSEGRPCPECGRVDS